MGTADEKNKKIKEVGDSRVDKYLK